MKNRCSLSTRLLSCLVLIVALSKTFGLLSVNNGRSYKVVRGSKSLRRTTSTPSQDTLVSFDPEYYVPFIDHTPHSMYGSQPRITLTRFLSDIVKENPELNDLESLLLAVQMACKTISNLVNRAGLAYSIQHKRSPDNYSDGRYYSMKRLDRLSTTVLKNALKFTGTVQLVTPTATMDHEKPCDHQPGVLIASAVDSTYVACLDPLDGSGNADASICTGTVFGVFEKDEKGEASEAEGKDATSMEEQLVKAVLQPAKNMRAAGYCLYSSATVLVFTLKDYGVYGFTLDPQIQEFVLTHDQLTIPSRGNVYSCNEANSKGWEPDSPWNTYLNKLKLGEGQTKTRYAHRYVGSMVGDIHRTLLYGGMFAYPSDKLFKPQGNLQLLYKVAPMAFIVSQAGGKTMDETGCNLLDKRPERIHQKSPCFMGSPADMDELATYFDALEDEHEVDSV